MHNEISFIILCYNDSQSLVSLIPDTYKVLKKNFSRFEIILADDGSKDDSYKTTLELKKSFPELRIVRHDVNKGVGACFATGLAASSFNLVGYIDGDYQYTPEDIPEMISHLNHYDAVSGIRVKRKDSFKRKIMSSVYNLLINMVFGMKFKDVNSGLKIYKRTFFSQSLPLMASGPFYDAEILIKGIVSGKRITEIPIKHFARKFGNAGGGSIKSVMRTLSEIRSSKYKHFHSRDYKSKLVNYALNLIGDNA